MRMLHRYILIAITGYLASGAGADVLEIPVKVNQDASLPCRLPMGSHKDVNVRWFSEKDGWLTSGRIVYKHQNQISVIKPAPNEWNLRIIKVTVAFEDTYTCKTEQGTVIRTVKLIIETSPKIDESASSPSRLTVKETGTAELTCAVTGSPTPEIHWYRGKNPIDIKGSVLKIPGITRYAADEYMCRAINKNGEAERRFNVTVSFAPEVTVMEPEVYAAGGEVAVMSCVVQGSPLYGTYWTMGTDVYGKPIKANWKYLVMQEDGGDGIPVKFLTLIIRKSILAHKDYGVYTCVAKGENQVAQAAVVLKEKTAVNAEEEKQKVIKYD
ncbi:hemicentin-2-like [Mercenaria mercenaria]|uniref:hemicentin-2-like n=1 Tax=Mercenaria mercenaria TaxID=6596 RepID=UPI00234F2E08|nr:hemicentin-2-like [Mercenaria mercenaria]